MFSQHQHPLRHLAASAALLVVLPLGASPQDVRARGDAAAASAAASAARATARAERMRARLDAKAAGFGDAAGIGAAANYGAYAAYGHAAASLSSSLADLGSLESLSSLQSLQSLQSLESLGTLQDTDGLTSVLGFGDGMRGYGYRTRGLDQGTDSLYRQAREAMNRGDFKRAANLFSQVSRRSGKSPIAGDALYWQAYALYRSGSSSELDSALTALTRLERDYPTASSVGDARTLRVRVCGELAKRGDAACAAEVAAIASTRRTERPERPDRPERPERPERAERSEPPQGCPRDDDDDERVAALNALLQMDSDKALPILERVLARRDRCSAALRRKAVFLVSQKGDARAADILMGAVKNDPDEEVREQAVFWLGQTRDPRAVDMLQQILKTETNDDVLSKAVFALSQHSSERANAIVRDLAQRDGAPLAVREQAIFWLGQQRGGDNAGLLRDLYVKVKEEQLKEKIIFAISQNRAAGNDKFLIDVALDAKEPIEMRKKALFWAGQNRSTSLDDLSALYNKISDREIKEQIIFVYSQRREPAAVDKLMDIAKNEKDKELRKKAVFWLSQSRDPRVPKFLEEIIG